VRYTSTTTVFWGFITFTGCHDFRLYATSILNDMPVAAYPGSFNPPTVAHLAVADAARVHLGLDRIDLVVSRRALAKEHVEHPPWDHRLRVVREVVASRPWLGLVVTEHQLLVDIARGYDVLVVGADKYHQIHEPRWYPSDADRARALAGLPRLAVAPRPPWATPPELALPLDVAYRAVSSTLARAGRRDLMAFEAARLDAATGLWSS